MERKHCAKSVKIHSKKNNETGLEKDNDTSSS